MMSSFNDEQMRSLEDEVQELRDELEGEKLKRVQLEGELDDLAFNNERMV